MQDLATGVSTKHNENLIRLQAMENRIGQNENWISQNLTGAGSNRQGANNAQKEKPIMEYHGVSSLGVIDKDKYAEWRDCSL